MNVVFISPHFPLYFHNFCSRLKQRGVNVLGIGDAYYGDISEETKIAVTEYYQVSSLENYEEVYRAVGYYISKYGRIDFIESQNEYWLETDAKLRSDFNVNSGTKYEHLASMKYKSKMKKVYEKCGVPQARYALNPDRDEAFKFIDEVGYPVVVKPDNGVGAISTYKLKSREEVDFFYDTKDDTIYIMEEFVDGHVETFDGISDANKNVLLCSSHVMLKSIMDNVNEIGDMAFYGQKVEGSDIEEIGRKVVKAFDTRSKFFHFEFFRLDNDKPGLGKKGDLVGLEVNMRAPGAYMPDMINYSYDCDVYSIWADMVVANTIYQKPHQKYVVGYVGRRHSIDYIMTHEQIIERYASDVMLDVEVPEVLSAAMGNHVYIIRTTSKEELFDMMGTILARKDGKEWFKKA